MMSKSCMRKPSIVKDGFFTLPRKTRPGIPHIMNRVYTREAFNNAMEEYIKIGGGLYMAPVTIIDETIYGANTTSYINTVVYKNFHDPFINKEYLIGKVDKWDDYTITFKYSTTPTTSKLIHLIDKDTKVNLRYEPIRIDSRTKQITSMKITMLDIPVIPFEVIGIDIQSVIEKMSKKGGFIK